MTTLSTNAYIPKEIMSLNLSATSKLLLLLISSMPKGFFMTSEEAAKALKVSRASIYRAKETLSKKGLVRTTLNEFGRNALYPVWTAINAVASAVANKINTNTTDLLSTTASGQYSTNCNEGDNMMVGVYKKDFVCTSEEDDFDLSFLDDAFNAQNKQEISCEDINAIKGLVDHTIHFATKLYTFNIISDEILLIVESSNHYLERVLYLKDVSYSLLNELISAGQKQKVLNTQNSSIKENNISHITSKMPKQAQTQTQLHRFSEKDIYAALSNYYKHTSLTTEQYATVAKDVFDFYTTDGRNFKAGKVNLTMTDICKKAYSWIKKYGFLQSKQQKITSVVAQQPELRAKQPPLCNNQVLQTNKEEIVKNDEIVNKPIKHSSKKSSLMDDIIRITNGKPHNLLNSKGGKELLEAAGFDIKELQLSA